MSDDQTDITVDWETAKALDEAGFKVKTQFVYENGLLMLVSQVDERFNLSHDIKAFYYAPTADELLACIKKSILIVYPGKDLCLTCASNVGLLKCRLPLRIRWDCNGKYIISNKCTLGVMGVEVVNFNFANAAANMWIKLKKEGVI